MSTRSVVFEEIQTVAAEQKKVLALLDDAAPLLTLGLDSLGFAILVARLEEKLGRDPFSASDEVEFPVTVGDLVRLYEHADV
ncbi:MAG: phosphopantetheine-binding protein [Beijerinckiaceae bacterium]|nr:phosphopantetheine-binding protein [Beijerinckiaceae bacterium]